MISPAPNKSQPYDPKGLPNEWQAFFSAVFEGISATQQHGTTAQRPTKNVFIGRFYFDDTIGKPIWWNGTIWVKADGTAA